MNVTAIAATVALIGSISGGILFVEDRFEKKEEAKKVYAQKQKVAQNFEHVQNYMLDMSIEQKRTNLRYYSEVVKQRQLSAQESIDKKLNEESLKRLMQIKEKAITN